MATLHASETSIFPTAIRNGLIGGLIYIVWTLIKNMSGLATNSFAGIVDFLIYGFVIYSAIKGIRDLQGDHISLGKSVGVGVVACALTGLLGGIFNYTYFNFIDPGAVDELITFSLEAMGSFLPEDKLEESAEAMKHSMTSLPTQVGGGIGAGVFFGLIGSLIGGAIMKKDPPPLV